MNKRMVCVLAAVLVALAACKPQEKQEADTGQASPEKQVAADTSGAKPQPAEADTSVAKGEADTAVAEPPVEQDAVALPNLEVPFQSFKLQNGLTVVVHEDHKAPIVAVNVWYHVGSKNEQEGRSGFAHLFEHLMFQGSENYKGEYFEPFEKVGATDMNGTTNEDRTNYFQNVPTPALDMALWMESDRMGHFMGSITQELLDEQRGVVQNEKRQGLNQPYGEVWELSPEYTYPKNHPYAHSVIGSMDDLNAATVDDVKKWFQTWYGPSNAVLVLAGDITLEQAKEKAELYFGDIAPGPGLTRPDVWISPMKAPTRLAISDEVPQARVYKVWNVPEWGNPQERQLELVVKVLSDGKNSRLYKRLVYDDELATDVRVFLGSGEIGSQLWIYATARPGVELSALEKALDEEIAKIRASGITQAELDRAKMQFFSSSVYGAERIGGFGGKSDLLARSQVLGGNPDAWKKGHDIIRAATTADVNKAVQDWITEGVFSLEVHPAEGFDPAKHPTDTPKRSATPEEGVTGVPSIQEKREAPLMAKKEGADRSKLPETGTPPDLVLPAFQRTKLSNGLEVVLAERHETPVVRMRMLVDAGYAADQNTHLGTANLAMQMLDEGTATMSALELSGKLEDLGASIGTGSSIDTSTISLGALTTTLEPALELYAEVITQPAFPKAELERLRKRALAGIQQEKSNPVRNALRILGPLMFGEGHAYGVPLTGSGDEKSVTAITRKDLEAFHGNWIRPDKATLVVVGDVTLEALKPQLEKAFSNWKASGPEPAKNLSKVSNPEAARVYLVNKPGAEQSVIIGGLIAPPRRENDIPMKLMNGVLGGQFTSRLNMNLREDKHWAYGSYSFVFSSQNQRLMGIYAPVQTDKTAESMAELLKEIQGIVGPKPPTEPELQRLRDNYTLKLPGENETTGELLGNIAEIVEYGLPDNYWTTYVSEVRGMPLAKVGASAKEVVKPGRVTWIVVGDLTQIQEPITALGIGTLEVLNTAGPPAEKKEAPAEKTPEEKKEAPVEKKPEAKKEAPAEKTP